MLSPPRFGGAKHASGHGSLLLFGHSSTEILVRVSVGEKSQTELECSRSVVLISKFALLCCYVRVPTPATMAASRRAPSTTRPSDGQRTVAFSPSVQMNDCYSGAFDEIGDEGNMAAPAKRIDGIDFWRGLALLMIFIDHVPENVFQHVTQKNFGFSDAAELFVFLAGVSVALAYGTRFFEGETVGAVRAVLRRAFTLYWVQILISLLIIAIFVGAAALWNEDDLLEDADAVVSNPLQTTAGILALLHQLENANILPLYIALLLMTPLLLALARRDDRLMLAASAGIYLAARAFSLNLSTWPVEGTWFFNPILRGSSSSPSAFSQDADLSAAVSPTTRGSSPLASLSSRSPR